VSYTSPCTRSRVSGRLLIISYRFFNTYVLYNGTQAVGQYCAMYNETWSASYATNVGQWRGADWFSIGYSYAFSNTTGGADQPTSCANPSSA